jgi:superfamily I DNA/RNA helicase
MMAKLKGYSQFSVYQLTVNCRNTKPIGEEIRTLCGLENHGYLSNKIHGEPVSYYFFDDRKEESEKIENLINRIITSSVKPEGITILSPLRFENSVISQLTQKLPIATYDKRQYEQMKGFVQFSTIHSYKGLENSIIILSDIERITGDEYQNLLYVGMSRARVSLHVFLTKKLENEYNQIIRKSLEKPMLYER